MERNASIESTTLGFEDHGIFTFYLHLSYTGTRTGSHQSFGGYSLTNPIYKKAEGRKRGEFIRNKGCAFGADILLKILETLKVEAWEKLPGTPLRVRMDKGKISEIAHFLEDNWLNMKELYEEHHDQDMVDFID